MAPDRLLCGARRGDVAAGQRGAQALDAGLFFLAFQRDPEAFVSVQRRLGANDKLNEYIKHVGSGVWAIPPGAQRGGWVGQTLLGAHRR